MLTIYVHVHTALLALATRRDERGQATAEYALVLLGAAAIAVLIVSYATKSNIVGKLFDFVLGKILSKAGGSG